MTDAATAADTHPAPEKLMNFSFVLLVQGLFVSRIGNSIWMLVLVLWLKDITQSPSIVGLVTMCTAIPPVLFGVIGGGISDQFSRKKVIVWSDFINGFFALVAALALLTGVLPESAQVPVLVALALIGGVTLSIFTPAVQASIPDLVPTDKLDSANGAVQFVSHLAMIVGYGIAGGLFVFFGGPVVLMIYGLSYIISAISEAFIRLPDNSRKKTSTDEPQKSWGETYIKAGFQYFRDTQGMKALFMGIAAINFFAAPLIIIAPFFIEDVLGYSSEWYGYVMLAFSIGVVVGGLSSGLLKITHQHKGRVLALLMMLFSIFIALMGLCTTIMPLIVVIFFVGVTSALINVMIVSAMQIATPQNIRGRVFGLVGSAASALAPLGMGLTGLVIDLLDHNIPLILLGSGFGSFLVALFLLFNTGLQVIMQTQAEPEAAAG